MGQKMRWFLRVGLACLLFISAATLVLAHGVVISYNANDQGEIEFVAEFDNGEPMSDAQVTIYAPDDPANPWLTGKADEAGRFAFAPDQPGRWDVQFRVAGHGDIVHIDVEEKVEAAQMVVSSSTAGGGGFTALQILLMSGSVIWGFIGTALYFSSRRSS